MSGSSYISTVLVKEKGLQIKSCEAAVPALDGVLKPFQGYLSFLYDTGLRMLIAS